MVFSEDCYPPGDTNWDGTLDILDIVVTVNSALVSDFNECSDINYDLEVNVLDIVKMVNVILNQPDCLYPGLTQIPDGNPLIAYGSPIVASDLDVLYDEEAGVYKMWHTAYRNQILGIGYGVSEDGLDWDLEEDGS